MATATDPFTAAQPTYRRFAAEDRPGSPWEVPFDPRPRYPINLIKACLVLAAGCVVISALWLL